MNQRTIARVLKLTEGTVSKYVSGALGAGFRRGRNTYLHPGDEKQLLDNIAHAHYMHQSMTAPDIAVEVPDIMCCCGLTYLCRHNV